MDTGLELSCLTRRLSGDMKSSIQAFRLPPSPTAARTALLRSGPRGRRRTLSVYLPIPGQSSNSLGIAGPRRWRPTDSERPLARAAAAWTYIPTGPGQKEDNRSFRLNNILSGSRARPAAAFGIIESTSVLPGRLE